MTHANDKNRRKVYAKIAARSGCHPRAFVVGASSHSRCCFHYRDKHPCFRGGPYEWHLSRQPHRPDDRTPWPLWPVKYRMSYAMEEALALERGEQDYSVTPTRFQSWSKRVAP